ncbi:1-deoxy-D-xylulose-5-phosphate synthase [Sphingobacterium sp.]|uniref:1-deoxy-D-xylulose-5-phosphate synthase n=1 Tax=Sphingobacterium sp. TaxID=341027 RepID=UPI0028A04AC7|nr:1-deoxy-D-xylulose-5-phosphate synthase [Sphingobacterium sp.]
MALNYNINIPQDLRNLPTTSLTDFCEDLRSFLIDHISLNGGHFSSSLGVVELTVALHYVFNTPTDKIVWDVGHQAYPHKLITGRRGIFHTNRMEGGISGFPSREESEFDAFGTGHSSTSISAILGMACAARYRNENDRQHIAVIGDGAMTAGLAFEGLNNVGFEKANMLIILNDNNMSIDANTGALQHYLTGLTAGKQYNMLKSHIKKLLLLISQNYDWPLTKIRKLEKIIKSGILDYSNLFEALNIRYFGPVNGHDIQKLTSLLEKLKYIRGPKILHCVTVKGKGYLPALTDQANWHATGKFDKQTGERLQDIKQHNMKTFQAVFCETLVKLARKNKRIIAITPAMMSGSALTTMKKEMPDRVFDVGIAEQHAVTFSAGLAAEGLIPFCTIYSTFLQRAYDQVIHDAALQKLNIIFCIDRAGVVGPDGPTHHGAFDISFLRCVPNIIGASPINLEDFRNLLYTAQEKEEEGPFAIRYPKGNGISTDTDSSFRKLEIGKGQKMRDGDDIAILSLGPIGQYAIAVCEELALDHIEIAHYDLRFFKPLDEDILHQVFQKFSVVVTIEDGCIVGGVGSGVMEFMVEHGYSSVIKRLGLPDTFASQGTQQQIHEKYGYGKKSILAHIRKLHHNFIMNKNKQ